jgi:hypothetical protein
MLSWSLFSWNSASYCPSISDTPLSCPQGRTSTLPSNKLLTAPWASSVWIPEIAQSLVTPEATVLEDLAAPSVLVGAIALIKGPPVTVLIACSPGSFCVGDQAYVQKVLNFLEPRHTLHPWLLLSCTLPILDPCPAGSTCETLLLTSLLWPRRPQQRSASDLYYLSCRLAL